MRWSPLLLLPLFLPLPMNASDSGLHPLSTLLPEAEVRIILRGIADAGEEVGIECHYRAQRERDVKKSRSWHVFSPAGRIGSNDLVTTQREEALTTRLSVTATGEGVAFSVPFHPPEGEHRNWGLERIRVGRVEFAAWSEVVPVLDPGFGLMCSASELRGTFRRGGINALPLRGSLPLWPTLRQVELIFDPVCRPEVRLWDAAQKHHWDGWRTTTPEGWPGGTTVTVRHREGPTVWRLHELHPVAPGRGAPYVQPSPPVGATPGLELEVFWPEGAELEFPEVKFDGSVDVLALPLAKLDARARELLRTAGTLRPGVELLSLNRPEWKVFATLADDDPSGAVGWELRDAGNDRSVLVARRVRLEESYVFLFGSDYDEDRRVAIAGIVLHPRRWDGPVPPE